MKLSDAKLALELNTQRENLIGRAERILTHEMVKISVGHHKTEEISIPADMISDAVIRLTLEQVAEIDKQLVEMGFDKPDPPFFDSDLKEGAERIALAIQATSEA